MKYSQQEIIQYVQEEDVKFIRLAFCDVFGKQKNISIMPYSVCQRNFIKFLKNMYYWHNIMMLESKGQNME